jgi:hypothetical protein
MTDNEHTLLVNQHRHRPAHLVIEAAILASSASVWARALLA